MTFNTKKNNANANAMEAAGGDVVGTVRRAASMNFMPMVDQVKQRKKGGLEGALEALREDYQLPQHQGIKSSRPQRLAHVLAWLVVNYPGVLVPYADLHLAIWGLTKPVASTSKEVKQLRGSAGAADKALAKHYGMRVVRGPQVDVRASRIDDFGEDLAKHVLKQNNLAYLRAADKMMATLGMIRHPTKIADQETKRFVQDTNNAVKKLAAEDLLKRLTPPASWMPDKKKKTGK